MIDHKTVEKILDAADIVDVVSDFVALKQRGANWVGLCPFHNDRRPSFYVSRAKGFCKCFSCGEGGGTVSFIMKHEQMTYPEALRYLAKKYHIEIVEKELTDEEREEEVEKESMFVINEFAMNFFEKQLSNTQEGQDIGLSYFRERGFSDESIRNFHLGYSPECASALHDAAVKAGYNEDILVKVGLCWKDEKGRWFDKFRGRVIFPVFTMGGKVVAFGGRTLRNHPAKYLNSPESLIYHKRKTIYGLYQAKRDIAKLDKCFIVEGYADVISMHQAGFKNVIATSGTALTPEHIHTIHNLTSNVTELFDGDAAGIKAALKGVDLLLKQDLNIKILVLPNPQDPDSFAQNHSATEITDYINKNEQDFINFKTNTLLADCSNDPIKKVKVVESVLRSVAHIPNQITRSVYAQECVKKFQIQENVIQTQIQRYRAQILEEDKKQAKANNNYSVDNNSYNDNKQSQQHTPESTPNQATPSTADSSHNNYLQLCELEVIKYMLKFGCSIILDYENITVMEWLTKEIEDDRLQFSTPLYQAIFELCKKIYADFPAAFNRFKSEIEEKKVPLYDQEIEKIRSSIEGNIADIERLEGEAKQGVDEKFNAKLSDFRRYYFYKHLSANSNNEVRDLVDSVCLPKHNLSKIQDDIFSKEMQPERLLSVVSSAMFNWKLTIIEQKRSQLESNLKNASIDAANEILSKINELNTLRKEFSKLIGERVVSPKGLN